LLLPTEVVVHVPWYVIYVFPALLVLVIVLVVVDVFDVVVGTPRLLPWGAAMVGLRAKDAMKTGRAQEIFI
jgi:hypothetical protein